MTNLAQFHVKTVRDGEADFIDHAMHSMVRHDSKTFYYDFTGLDVTVDEFRAFVMAAWDLWDDDRLDCGAYDKEHGTLYADVS